MSIVFRKRLAAALHSPSACLLEPDVHRNFRDEAVWASSVGDLSPLNQKLLDLAEIELDWGEKLPAEVWNDALNGTLASATMPLSSANIELIKKAVERWPAGTPGGLGGQFKPLSGAIGDVRESLAGRQKVVLGNILDYLSQMRAMRSNMVTPELEDKSHYYGPEDLVLKEGRVFSHFANEDPSKDSYCEPNRCFTNAMMIATRDPERTYVEGWAMRGDGIMPTHHAWTVNHDGGVYDPTWGHHDDSVYVGVPFETKYLTGTVLPRGYDTMITEEFPYDRQMTEDEVVRGLGDPLPPDTMARADELAQRVGRAMPSKQEQPTPEPERSWEGFPLDERLGQKPKPTDTPPERTPSGDFILYHGTSKRNADTIMRENRLRPDDLGVVGITTIPGQAQTFAAMSSRRGPRAAEKPEIVRVSQVEDHPWSHNPRERVPMIYVPERNAIYVGPGAAHHVMMREKLNLTPTEHWYEATLITRTGAVEGVPRGIHFENHEVLETYPEKVIAAFRAAYPRESFYDGMGDRIDHGEGEGGVVLRLVVDKTWMENQSITREVGGSGHDQFLIQAPIRMSAWSGIPADALKNISTYDFENPDQKTVTVHPYIRDGHPVEGYVRSGSFHGLMYPLEDSMLFMAAKPHTQLVEGREQAFWKAIWYPQEDEFKLWFPNRRGQPHHDDIRELYAKQRDYFRSDEGYNLAGYGSEFGLEKTDAWAPAGGMSGAGPLDDLIEQYKDEVRSNPSEFGYMDEPTEKELQKDAEDWVESSVRQRLRGFGRDMQDAVALTQGGKSAVAVDPYVREGRPVAGYLRELRQSVPTGFPAGFWHPKKEFVFEAAEPTISGTFGGTPGISWKAAINPETDEKKIWTVNASGQPQHDHVARALDWHTPKGFFVVGGIGAGGRAEIDYGYRMYGTEAGYGPGTSLTEDQKEAVLDLARRHARTLRDWQHIARKSAKAQVQVRPYIREGHPVAGYTRELSLDETLDEIKKTADVPEIQEFLTNLWSALDRALYRWVGRPHEPQARHIIEQQKAVSKVMHHRHLDSGKVGDLGKPGGPRDVVIVGAGPAGLQAAIYGGLEGLDTMLIDANPEPGGQARLSTRIENVPGFPAGVDGKELATNCFDQVERVGAECVFDTRVTEMRVDPKSGMKTLTLSNGKKIRARSVILAGGVQFVQLKFPGSDSEDVIYGDAHEIQAHSRGKPVVLVGGANSAGQAAIALADEVPHVTLLVRHNIEGAMSSYLISQLREDPRITILENAEIETADTDADGRVESVTLKGGTTVDAGAVGIFVGSAPRADWSEVERDGRGFVLTGQREGASPLETSTPGVYAAGDIRSSPTKRVATAFGDGAMALAEAHHDLLERAKRAAARSGEKAATMQRLLVVLSDPNAVVEIANAMPDDAGDDMYTDGVALDQKQPYVADIETDPAEGKSIQVKPYIREGRPVAGYVREGDMATRADLLSHFLPWGEKLNAHELLALSAYQSQAGINDKLRHGESDSLVPDLDSAIESGTVPKRVKVRRWLSTPLAFDLPAHVTATDDDYLSAIDSLVGHEFLDLGYMSTTMNEQLAHEHGGRYGQVELDVPAGTHGALLDAAPIGMGDFGGDVGLEKELLLGRQTRIRITGSHRDPSGDIILDAAVLGGGASKSITRPTAPQSALDRFAWGDGDLIPLGQATKSRSVRVKPYFREGHLVEGYVRQLADEVLGDGWSFNPRGLPEPDFSAMKDSVKAPEVDPNELVTAFHGLGKGDVRIAIQRVVPSGKGVRIVGYFSSPGLDEAGVEFGLRFLRFDLDVQSGRMKPNDIFLPPDRQSAGMGTALMRYIEAYGRDHGQQRIDITAAHVGSYAWARAGFDFKFPGAGQASLLGHETPELRDRYVTENQIEIPESVPDSVIEDFISRFATERELEDAYDAFYEHYADLSSDELDVMPQAERESFIDKHVPLDKFRHVIEIAEFGRDHQWEDERYGRMWVGKAWLIGRKWDGTKEIVGAKQKGLSAPMLQNLYDHWCRQQEALNGPSFGDVAPDGYTFFSDDDGFWRAYDELAQEYEQQIPPAGSAKDIHIAPYVREGRIVEGYWRDIEPAITDPRAPYIRRRLPDGFIEAYESRQALNTAISLRNNIAYGISERLGDRPDLLDASPEYQSAEAEIKRLERITAEFEDKIGGRIFRVHDSKLPKVEKKIAKLQKAAEKIGLKPPELHIVGEEYIEANRPHVPRGQGEQNHWLYLQVTGSEPKIEGWQFLATLQHLPDGINVIRRVPGSDESVNIDQYREGEARCDYCHTLRDRNDTFLLADDAGKVQQVGRNCLRDFLGHGNPAQMVGYLENWIGLDSLDLPDDEDDGADRGGRPKTYVPTQAYLTHVATMIRTEGWVSRSASHVGRPTADAAMSNYYAWLNQEKDRSGRRLWEEPTDEDARKASEALAWVREVLASKESKTEFDHNMTALAQGDYVPERGQGILAYSLVSHAKAQEREIQMRRREETASKSEHIGEVGKRLKLKLTVEMVWARGGDYGVTYITKFSDEHGNIVKWFGSYELTQGQTYEATWTIKKHDEFRGAKETVITRPHKLTEVEEGSKGAVVRPYIREGRLVAGYIREVSATVRPALKGRGALPMADHLYYRFHAKSAPFGPENATSRNLVSDEDLAAMTPEVAAIVGRTHPGYSAFWNPHHLDQYLRAMGWDTAPDAKDREVVAFLGTPIAGGGDGEPVVRPESKILGRMTLSRFRDRLEVTPDGYGLWDEHTWGQGPDRQIVDDGYRSLADLRAGKHAVQVRPYIRDGHPVIGYIRDGERIIPSLHSNREDAGPIPAGGRESGRSGPDVRFSETTDYEAFNRAISANPRSGFLSEHPPEELSRSRVFLSADRKAGFVVTADRDLQNVFRNPGGIPGAGRAAVRRAVAEGARTLDAYDGFLPSLYQEEGFGLVGRMKWSDEAAPDGWDYEKYGRPDVVFMAVNPPPDTKVRSFTDWDEAKRYSLAVSRNPNVKSAVRVRPYFREGRPVVGYTREEDLVPHPVIGHSIREFLDLPKSGKLREYGETALAAVDKVLALPEMPRIPLRATSGKNLRGGYGRKQVGDIEIEKWEGPTVRLANMRPANRPAKRADEFQPGDQILQSSGYKRLVLGVLQEPATGAFGRPKEDGSMNTILRVVRIGDNEEPQGEEFDEKHKPDELIAFPWEPRITGTARFAPKHIKASVHSTDRSSFDDAPAPRTPEETIIHEIGHFLDNAALANDPDYQDFASTIAAFWALSEEDRLSYPARARANGNPEVAEKIERWLSEPSELEPWYRAVMRTKAVEELQTVDSITEQPTQEYLLGAGELLARSFAQWISMRSGDPKLIGQMRAWQNQPLKYEAEVENMRREKVKVERDMPRRLRFNQWQDDDFAPVAFEFDRLFERLGWLKPTAVGVTVG